MNPADACRLHAHLQFRSANDPTKVGQAARDVIVQHGPQVGDLTYGPDQAVCTGEGVPVAYPCSTTRTIAHAVGVALPPDDAGA